MAFFRLNPIARKRLSRFRHIKRGYYSLLILIAAVVVSLFSNFVANNKAIAVKYNGELYFPTYRFIAGSTFGQSDDYFPGAETDYRKLAQEFEGTENWVLMPPIPFSPLESDYDYYFASSTEPVSAPFPPDSRHIFGTDAQARDVAARLLYGFRISILFSLGLVLVSQTIGVAIGLMQGFLGGWFDLLSQRAIEIWSNLPFLFVVILLATFFEMTFWKLLAIMAIFDWIGITYYMRTETYREKSREYALAARSIGASKLRIVFKHILPNSLTPLITLLPFRIVAGILSLTALDYLGYGLPAPTPSWGEMIEQGLQNLRSPWLSLAPFLAITITLTLVTMIGESVREAFDPKQFARYR